MGIDYIPQTEKVEYIRLDLTAVCSYRENDITFKGEENIPCTTIYLNTGYRWTVLIDINRFEKLFQDRTAIVIDKKVASTVEHLI
jgi:hypothetical protein